MPAHVLLDEHNDPRNLVLQQPLGAQRGGQPGDDRGRTRSPMLVASGGRVLLVVIIVTVVIGVITIGIGASWMHTPCIASIPVYTLGIAVGANTGIVPRSKRGSRGTCRIQPGANINAVQTFTLANYRQFHRVIPAGSICTLFISYTDAILN